MNFGSLHIFWNLKQNWKMYKGEIVLGRLLAQPAATNGPNSPGRPTQRWRVRAWSLRMQSVWWCARWWSAGGREVTRFAGKRQW
jgi:hypothetical protein